MDTIKQRHVDSQQQKSCSNPEIILQMLATLLASRQPVTRMEFEGFSNLYTENPASRHCRGLQQHCLLPEANNRKGEPVMQQADALDDGFWMLLCQRPSINASVLLQSCF